MQEDQSLPFERMVKSPSEYIASPLMYRGGKASLVGWMLPHIPPHTRYVEVFGGGGSLFFAKGQSDEEVYNDIGNVAKFFWALQNYGDEIYRKLYFTPMSREFFLGVTYHCDEALDVAQETGEDKDWITWAWMWYLQVQQSYRHEEDDHSWGGVTPSNYTRHIDDLPYIVSRLKGALVENQSFDRVIPAHDSKSTLFYCDPPYIPTSWESKGYRNLMPEEKHVELLEILNQVEGQVMLSGYPSKLYESYTKGWKRIEKTRTQGIKNSSLRKVGERTEVLWIRSHNEGLWSPVEQQEKPQANVARIYSRQADIAAINAFIERNKR